MENADEARLQASYEAAKGALSTCERIDECQDWADKAEALASYARQAGDESARRTLDRIQARAVRRCGELLKQFDGRPQNRSRNQSGGAPTLMQFEKTQRQAAEEAGMSRDQQVTAVRVANVPEETFETAVESPEPPTVTKLAEQGRRRRPVKQQPAAAGDGLHERRNPWRYWNDLRDGLDHLGQLPAPADVTALRADSPKAPPRAV